MSEFTKHLTVTAVALLALSFGSVQEAQAGVITAPKPANCRDLPVIKNLTGLKAQHVCDRMAAPKELTKREVKKLAATAKSPEDHLTIARYYTAEANGLDAQVTAYEKAAANLRNGPIVKNFTSPTTAGRLEFATEGFREEAKADRTLAVRHETMAAMVVVSLN
jgi:hypothetical protein